MRLSNLNPRLYPVEKLCRLLGVTRQAYYDRISRDVRFSNKVQEEQVVAYIQEQRKKDPRLGINKIYIMSMKGGLPESCRVGRNKMYSIASDNGLLVRETRKAAPRTTDSRHHLSKYPNLVASFIPTAPNQLWVSDITYLELWLNDKEYVFCYVTIIMDAYSRMIKGWDVSDSLEASHALDALKMAVESLGGEIPEGLIHHSDRGVQYASILYVEYLRAHGIAISMTESGNPKENPMSERINSTLKNELLLNNRFEALEAARNAISEAIWFYNYERPHMSIDYLTPAEAEKRTGIIRKRWRSFRDEAIFRELAKDAQKLMVKNADIEEVEGDMPFEVFLGLR